MKFISLTHVDYQCTDSPRREEARVNADLITNMMVVSNPVSICKLMPTWTEITFVGGYGISVEECPEEIERRINNP